MTLKNDFLLYCLFSLNGELDILKWSIHVLCVIRSNHI